MKKLKLSLFLLLCFLGSSFMPLYADNDIKVINSTNDASFSQYNSFSAPSRKPKSKRKSSMKAPKKQGEFHVGLELGANMTSVTPSQGYEDIKIALFQALGGGFTDAGSYVSAPGIGFQVGVYFDYNITEVLFFEAGIYGIQRNFKETLALASPMVVISAQATASPLYARIPILLGANFSLSETSSLYIKAGPYLGYGISGKFNQVISTATTGMKPQSMESSSNFFESSEKMDYGIRAGLGFEFSKITIGFSFDYGLSNIMKNPKEGVPNKA